jgi:cation:H+ antiporter
MLSVLLILAVSFIALWVCTGVSISAIEKLSKRTHVSSFITSFFALGFLTSLTEISVAIFATIDKTPSISVGDLLGAAAVLTLLVIPLQVLSSKGIAVNTKADYINLPTAYLVISLPVILILDGNLSTIDAIIMIFSYIFLLLTISHKKAMFTNLEHSMVHPPISIFKEIFKLLVGSILVIVFSRIVVNNLILLSGFLKLSEFVVGLIILSIGTSTPEISILIRSYIFKDRNVALGDYLGSASLNVLILGFLVFANGGSIKIDGGVKYNLLLLPLGAVLFLLFAKNKKFEQKEAGILIFLYAAFIALEFIL